MGGGVSGLISRRINAERLVLLAWSRAILLQMAHPLIAAGIADHSSFRDSSLEGARRLRQTIRAMLALTFGDDATQARVIGGIRAIHKRVHGHLRDEVGVFPAGTPYSAEDPSLLLWVHATLLDSVPLVYQAIVGPLTSAELDAYCEEAAPIAIALGARATEVPVNSQALQQYMSRMYASGVIVPGPEARALATAVVSSRLALMAWPLGWANRQLTIGWLPPSIRTQYGFAWRQRDERWCRRIVALLRRTRRLMPDFLALWPEARRRPEGMSPASTGQSARG